MEDGQTIREANKVCGVCGDRALGYNFNAVSCESCKAFFRRNALKNKEFRCPFTENCSITPVTRRFCQKCRLDKCFTIGMKKEYIMSEEDKVLKRNKIELNRAKKRPSLDNHKITKTKKESVEDTTFDDTSTSLTSVASVASIVSEAYFWESDRNLDVNKQLAVDNLSPITASSVPSPSSPPENSDIASSKTLEMLKDPIINSIAPLSKNDCSIPYDFNEFSSDKSSSSQLNFNSNFKHEIGFTTEPIKITDSIVTSSFMENKSQDPLNFLPMPKCSKHVSQFSHCHTFNSTVNKQNEFPSTIYSTNINSMETCINQATLLLSQSQVEDKIEKENIAESILGECDTKSAEIPDLSTRLLENPSVLTKVFQDHNFLEKFISDSDIINKLVLNTELSQILETYLLFTDNKVYKSSQEINCDKNIISEQIMEKDISINCYENSLSGDQNFVQNPILTNLITNQSVEEKIKQSSGNTCEEEKKSSKIDAAKDILEDVQKEPIATNSIESILCEAIKLEYSAFSSWNNQSSRELNDAERAKLNELIVAHKALLAPLDEDISNLVSDDCKLKGIPGEEDPTLLGVINLTALAIRRLIKMSKKISAFKNMCQEDQLALLKGGCTEMMILRSAINYDPDKEIWKIPHSQDRMVNLKVEVLKEAKGNLYDEHSKFVRTFDSRWRDENIILILSAIALFSPKRPRVIHSDVIKLEQNSYYFLLRRYLESIYPGCEAKSTFLKLIKKMSELQRLNEEVVGVYLNVNPSDVEPLLIEIFDLKH